tara:strand:+ start:2234 stop:2461 length:228 start_codon:yes stop_codon:yes gene_type:complete
MIATQAAGKLSSPAREAMMNTRPGHTPQATEFTHGPSAPNAGATAGFMLDALLRQHKATRRTFQDWFDARLTRRR